MSDFRVCKITKDKNELINFTKFDDKQDAEHFAKNQSVSDVTHQYEIQKNHDGEFKTIKAYKNGQVI